MKTTSKLALSKKQCEELLGILKNRFEKNVNRHKGLEWAKYNQSWKAMRKNYGR